MFCCFRPWSFPPTPTLPTRGREKKGAAHLSMGRDKKGMLLRQEEGEGKELDSGSFSFAPTGCAAMTNVGLSSNFPPPLWGGIEGGGRRKQARSRDRETKERAGLRPAPQ